jgi:hypothetical protein
MASTKLVFLRKEIKYILSENVFLRILPELTAHLRPDDFPTYTICNLYFDNNNFDLIRNSLDKPFYKEKLRLRSYGVPSPGDKVFLEIKRKYDGMVAKRRVSLTLEEAEAYINQDILPSSGGQKMAEIDYLVKLYGLRPKLFLSYKREAYAGSDGLRVTFDTDILCRTNRLSLTEGVFGSPLLSPGQRIMEIKTDTAFPLWLTGLLSKNKIYPAGFSKYGEFYKSEKNGSLPQNSLEGVL